MQPKWPGPEFPGIIRMFLSVHRREIQERCINNQGRDPNRSWNPDRETGKTPLYDLRSPDGHQRKITLTIGPEKRAAGSSGTICRNPGICSLAGTHPESNNSASVMPPELPFCTIFGRTISRWTKSPLFSLSTVRQKSAVYRGPRREIREREHKVSSGPVPTSSPAPAGFYPKGMILVQEILCR